MALTESLPVHHDVYTLGQDIKRDPIIWVRSIYRANRSVAKTEHLEEFLDNFEMLQLEIRLCVVCACSRPVSRLR